MRFWIILIVVSLSLPFHLPLHAQPNLNTEKKLRKIPLEHFSLWSQRDLSKREIFQTRRNLMNVRRDVGRTFHVFPEAKFDVILTEDRVFWEYSKTGRHVTGLFDGRIHLPVPSGEHTEKDRKSILWHEYTHALLWWLSKGFCPNWINEGFAVFHEEKVRKARKIDSRRLLKSSEKNHLVYSIKDLDMIFKSPRNVSVENLIIAYEQAYAIADYLVDRYPRATLRKFFASMGTTKNFEKSLKNFLHLTIEELESEVVSYIGRKSK